MRYGDIHTRIPGSGVTPPPAGPTLDTVTLLWTGGPETSFYIGQLYFGTSGTGGGYSTNQTTFLAAHPGLTLQDFSGIAAPGGTAAVPSLSGFSVVSSDPGNTFIYDSAATTPVSAFCSLGVAAGSQSLTITFSPAISAVGFFMAQNGSPGDVAIAWYSGGTGGTQLDVEEAFPNNTGTFTTFAGYSV